MGNKWIMVEYYRFQMEHLILKLDFPFKNWISHFKMGSDGSHGHLGAPPAPPGAHDTHRNPFQNGKSHFKMKNPILK